MIIVNYDENPKNSIFYISALLYNYLINTCSEFESAYRYFINNILRNDLMFYYSLDWLFLLNKIKRIEKGLIICA